MTATRKPKIVNVVIDASCVYNATRANPINSRLVQNLIALFDGKTVEARVYGVNNQCFSVTEEMIRDAWATYPAGGFSINDEVIEELIKHFPKANLACALPSMYIEISSFHAMQEQLKVA